MSSFNLTIDYKAPDSENTLISKEEVDEDKKKYKKIFVLFDNDDAGVKAAYRYRDVYGLDPIFLNYGEKDPSDHVKKFGPKKVYFWYVPLINKHINK